MPVNLNSLSIKDLQSTAVAEVLNYIMLSLLLLRANYKHAYPVVYVVVER